MCVCMSMEEYSLYKLLLLPPLQVPQGHEPTSQDRTDISSTIPRRSKPSSIGPKVYPHISPNAISTLSVSNIVDIGLLMAWTLLVYSISARFQNKHSKIVPVLNCKRTINVRFYTVSCTHTHTNTHTHKHTHNLFMLYIIYFVLIIISIDNCNNIHVR